MLSDVWGDAAKSVWDRLAASSAGAAVFWLGGLLAWSLGRGGPAHLRTVTDWLGRQSASATVAVLVVVLVAVATSGLLVQRLTLPILRLMEGYWPRFLEGRRSVLAKRVADQAARDSSREKVLSAVVDQGGGTLAERREFARLTQRGRRIPGEKHGYQPTRLGNILRAAETRPADKYGLDVIYVWPHMWLLFPEEVRKQLEEARQALDSAVAGCIWGLAFVAFAPWTLWVVPVGLLVAAAIYRLWLPVRAEAYADLLEASIDLYRTLLYRQLRWPLPQNPDNEPEQGKAVTIYLVRQGPGKVV